MLKAKLSICIPTYNRAQYLPELLDSIVEQAPTDGSVEICISDNASIDNTREIIESYKVAFPYIVYHANRENLGADKNYLKCVAIASGEYCWLMGSDDKLVEQAISKIFYYIEKEQADILICSRSPWFYGQYISDQEAFCIGASHLYRISDDDDFLKYCESATGLGALFSYLSSIIFRRAIWIESGIETFVGTAYVHVAILFKAINSQKISLYYVAESLILCRMLNDSFLESGDTLKRICLDFNYCRLINIFDSQSKKNAVLEVLARAAKPAFKIWRLLMYIPKSTEDTIRTLLKYCDEHLQFVGFARRIRCALLIAKRKIFAPFLFSLQQGRRIYRIYIRPLKKGKLISHKMRG